MTLPSSAQNKRPRQMAGPSRAIALKSGGLLRFDTGLLHVLLQFARLEHFAGDIGAANEFALHVELGDRWPVRIGLDAVAQLRAFEHVGAVKIDAKIAQDLDDLAGEAALRKIGRAL